MRRLEWKRSVVRNALTRIGSLPDPVVRQTAASGNGRAYRNKMSLVVAGEKLGFYRQRSHDIVPIDACPIVLPELDARIARLNDAKNDPSIGRAVKTARHIVARAATGAAKPLLAFSTNDRSHAVRHAASRGLLRFLDAAGIVNTFAPAGENAVLGRKAEIVDGAGEIEEAIAGIRFRVSIGSFFQVNIAVVEQIYDYLRPAFSSPRNVLDLYCGAGTFSLFFARLGNVVFGVDQSVRAVREAQRNATLNGLEGARFEAGPVEAVLLSPGGRAALQRADVVFLDPPRRGCDERTLGRLASAGVPEIWYLSCDPATLARDLKFLAAKEYALESAAPFDMFPQTGHVEALAHVVRKRAGK